MQRLYPEAQVGGFTRHDGMVEFYTRVNALLDAESDVLDFGAGRAHWIHEPLPAMSLHLRSLHERVRSVKGVDVDPIVLENPTLDDATVIAPAQALPYEDNSFDLVLADYVLEHIEEGDAASVAKELMRVLKPGGWLAACTPNKWGMIGVGARMVPNRLHARVLSRLQPDRQVEDIFPTRYHLNTRRDLRRLFPAPDNRLVVYGHTSEPTYFGESPTAWRLAQGLGRLTPPRLAPMLLIFVQKN